MKTPLNLMFLIISLNLFSCKEVTDKTKVYKIEKKTEFKKQDSISKDLKINTKKTRPQKHYEHFFVNAKSGLNYRDNPKGNVLGKFPLNTRLKVIEYPKILDQITNNDKVLNGEWLGIENGVDTVYVFNAFLSSNYINSDMRIYRVSPFLKENNGETRTGFLNVSESYFIEEYYNNKHSENLISSKQISKDTIRLNSKQREKFLYKINVSELDGVFIYDINSGLVYSYKVMDLPAIACVNIYGQNSNKENGFEFGLDLGDSYNGGWNNFAYIGDSNPFQKGKLKPIIWSKDKKENFLEVTNQNNQKVKLNVKDFYQYQTLKTIYYSSGFRFIAIELSNNKIVFDETLTGGEGWGVNPLNYISDNENIYQFEGELFKNKPPVLFGLTYTSYGCSSIFFMNKSEPSIRILCDNRH